jgi:putative transposase
MTELQRRYLEGVVRRTSVEKHIGFRAEILVRHAQGEAKRSIARSLGTTNQTVRKWIGRFEVSSAELVSIEDALNAAEDYAAAVRAYKQKILEAIGDAPRSGTPPSFSAEQMTFIVALACESLDESDEGTSYRTQQELAQEAVKREIVGSISQSTVSRILKNHGSKAA